MECGEMNLSKTSLIMAPLRPGLLVTIASIAISGLLPQQSNADGIDYDIEPDAGTPDIGGDCPVNAIRI